MIQTITEMLHMYCAIFLYYILKLPYGLGVMALTALALTGIVLGIHICLKLGKNLILPLLLFLLTMIIRFLQNIAFWLVKLIPSFEGAGTKIDEGLNRCGICLEGIRGWFKKLDGAIWRKIPTGKISLIIGIVICIFIIVPYYIEPSMTGNARQTCAKINTQAKQAQARLWGYVNQYYTPVVKVEPEQATEPESTEEHVVILHLGPDGRGGANLRSTPEKRSDNIIKAVSGDVELIFENEIEKSNGATWLKVRIDGGEEGWISKKLIEPEDLENAGIMESGEA